MFDLNNLYITFNCEPYEKIGMRICSRGIIFMQIVRWRFGGVKTFCRIKDAYERIYRKIIHEIRDWDKKKQVHEKKPKKHVKIWEEEREKRQKMKTISH